MELSTPMKKHYWFIALFGIWCLLSALWYFLRIKAVNTDPSVFNPHDSLIAIAEILVMLLGACLLGYAIAWCMRGETIQREEEKLDKVYAEKVILVENHDELKSQVELWREKHRADVGSSQERIAEVQIENESLHKQLTETESSLSLSQQEALAAQSKMEQVNSEVSTLRYRSRQLEFEVKEKEETVNRLKKELETAISQKEKPSLSDHPFVRPLESEEKDDLTKIKGVGPFIEKRLNMIGIYSYRQLAELSPDLVERVGAAIEFFPHRIIRDDWVGQARIMTSR